MNGWAPKGRGLRTRQEGPSTVVIRPSRGWAAVNLGELWRHRELLYFLAWRDVKVRYKQTAIGGAWAILHPLLMMQVFSLIFSQVAGVSSSDIPYPLFIYSALLPWQLFARGLTEASTSLVLNERLITRVYFPRILVPISVILSGLVDFVFALLVLIGMMLFYGIVPSVTIAALPLFVLLAVATAMGVSFWLSAMDVQYRDVRYTIPVLTQVWFFATPIFYSSDLISGRWQALFALNPMAGVVEGFRWAIAGQGDVPAGMIAASALMVALVFAGGLVYFRHTERIIADVV